MPTKGHIKKNNTARNTKIKKTEDNEDEEVVVLKKSVKPIEIEETDPTIDVEKDVEKPEEESLLEEGETDEMDEMDLNEEDIDPFGDKWEE